jgi:hypothetical protein
LILPTRAEPDAQGTELLPVAASGDKSKSASASVSAAAAAAAKVWHTKTAAACLAELETCATGLTTARVAEVYARVGPNALAEKPKPTFLERLWDQVLHHLLSVSSKHINGFVFSFFLPRTYL